MKNEFVPHDIAKQLKELGFSEPCLAWWFEESTVSVPTETRSFWSDWNVNPKRISAPLWQQVFRWFIEKYQLNGVPYYNFVGKWDYNIQRVEAGLLSGSVTAYIAMRDTYPEIQEACINRLISIVKERKNENKDSH